MRSTPFLESTCYDATAASASYATEAGRQRRTRYLAQTERNRFTTSKEYEPVELLQ